MSDIIEPEWHRTGFHNFLRIANCSKIEEYELQMISCHPECHLLPISQENDELLYEINDCIPFIRMFSEKTDSFDFVHDVILQMFEIIKKANEYLLSEDYVVLQSDMVFYQPEKHQIQLCYVPREEANIREQFKEFVEYIMKHMNHKHQELASMIYRIYHIISEENYSIEHIENEIKQSQFKHIEKRNDISQVYNDIENNNTYSEEQDIVNGQSDIQTLRLEEEQLKFQKRSIAQWQSEGENITTDIENKTEENAKSNKKENAQEIIEEGKLNYEISNKKQSVILWMTFAACAFCGFTYLILQMAIWHYGVNATTLLATMIAGIVLTLGGVIQIFQIRKLRKQKEKVKALS